MPFKSRLIQAIRDEEAKLRTEQTMHIVGPGMVVIVFIAIAGWLAVRVLHAPELFGGTFDIVGYGFLGVAIAGGLAKGYTLEQWLDRWVELRKAHVERVARIEAVMAKLEREELERAELQAASAAPEQPADDPWMRALATAPQEDGAAKEPS